MEKKTNDSHVVKSRPAYTVLPTRMVCCIRCGNEQVVSIRCDVCGQPIHTAE